MSCGGFDPGCRRCRLSEGRTQVVPGVGPCDARIVFIGEAPGRDEDAKGEPFRVDEIPFPETRHYVQKVLQAQKDYRKTYPKELGL